MYVRIAKNGEVSWWLDFSHYALHNWYLDHFEVEIWTQSVETCAHAHQTYYPLAKLL